MNKWYVTYSRSANHKRWLLTGIVCALTRMGYGAMSLWMITCLHEMSFHCVPTAPTAHRSCEWHCWRRPMLNCMAPMPPSLAGMYFRHCKTWLVLRRVVSTRNGKLPRWIAKTATWHSDCEISCTWHSNMDMWWYLVHQVIPPRRTWAPNKVTTHMRFVTATNKLVWSVGIRTMYVRWYKSNTPRD